MGTVAVLLCALPRLAQSADSGKTTEKAPVKKPKSIIEKAEAARTRLEMVEQAIMNANKMKECDGDGQCEALEAGTRNCGGPSTYFIVSAANPKLSVVKQKIIEFTSVQHELNTVDPPSDCMPIPPPVDARCVKNTCSAASRK